VIWPIWDQYLIEIAFNLGLDDESYSRQAKAGNAVVAPSATALSLTGVLSKGNININSGCLVTMTPYGDNVQSLVSNKTPVRLVDHSLVSATHMVFVWLAFKAEASFPALVVPDLHEPLLLMVIGLCNQNLMVVFTSASCEIFCTAC
jgi:hypothetical protein